VTSREPKKANALEVRIMFEPSRIASACLAQAYERIVPIARRAVASLLQNHRPDRDEIQSRRGGVQ
jgi:hypothetical protein